MSWVKLEMCFPCVWKLHMNCLMFAYLWWWKQCFPKAYSKCFTLNGCCVLSKWMRMKLNIALASLFIYNLILTNLPKLSIKQLISVKWELIENGILPMSHSAPIYPGWHPHVSGRVIHELLSASLTVTRSKVRRVSIDVHETNLVMYEMNEYLYFRQQGPYLSII